MARKYNRKRYRGRRKAGRKRNVLRISNKQARTRALDSKVEKIMARVAEDQISKNKVIVLYRQYLFGPYDYTTNTFTSSTAVDWIGHVQALARIQKMDNATMPIAVPAAQPYQTPATWRSPGQALIAPTRAIHGFRVGNIIKITGIRFGLRVTTQAASTQTAGFETCNLRWKIVACRWEDSHLPNAEPLIDQVLTMPMFGYNRALDDDETRDMKTRVLGSGKIKMRYSNNHPNVAFINRYLDLRSKPLKVEYNPLDQNGAEVLQWKPFLVIRSDVPVLANTQLKPRINAFTTVRYDDM